MFCFGVIRFQPFIVWLLKRLGLSCIPLKERKSLGRKLVRGPLELRFSAIPGCNIHGKNQRKKQKMHWTKKPPFLLTKTENQRPNWRKPANRTRHQNRKTGVLSARTGKPNQNPAKFSKSKILNASLNTDFVHLYDARKFLLRPLLSTNDLSQNKSFSIGFGYDSRSVLKHV